MAPGLHFLFALAYQMRHNNFILINEYELMHDLLEVSTADKHLITNARQNLSAVCPPL